MTLHRKNPSGAWFGIFLMEILVLGAAAVGQAQAVVTYRLVEDGHVYRQEVDGFAAPEDLSLALNALALGTSDEWVNISPDGLWLVLSSDRFDPACDGWECLAVVAADLSAGDAVRIGGSVVHGGFAAVASGGDLVVFEGDGGPHDTDLWATHRELVGWTPALLLTGASSHAYNAQPAISGDGTRVVFDCGPVPYGQGGTAICEVGSDGTGFQDVIAPADMPGAIALHHPDFAPDGSIVFEADPTGERIWRLGAGSSVPELVAPAFGNDNSPCVLADGRIVSLWLDRPAGTGVHELKIMDADGSDDRMLLMDSDIWDIGLGCGGTSPAIFADGFESATVNRWSTTNGQGEMGRGH